MVVVQPIVEKELNAAMRGFPSINRMIIWVENLKDYMKSWKVIINMNPTQIYPSHGKPFKVDDLKRYLHKVGMAKLYPLK